MYRFVCIMYTICWFVLSRVHNIIVLIIMNSSNILSVY